MTLREAQRLDVDAFWHEPARTAAPALLGRWLCRRNGDGSVVRARITEAEAYCGPLDRASHASRGRTPRNAVMFGPPGVWYVYLCYGVHWMLNLVTGPEHYPAAVLLRGVEGHAGPGRVTRALGIDRALNAAPCSIRSGLWIEGLGKAPSGWKTLCGPRVGVDYAGPRWAARPWRWRLEAQNARGS